MSLVLSPGFFFGLKAEQLQDLQAGGGCGPPTNQLTDSEISSQTTAYLGAL